MTQNAYKNRHRKFDGYYKKMGELFTDPCAYCGAPSVSYDHVPPLTETENNIELNIKTSKFEKYPACHDCNSWLINIPYKTLKERRRHLLKIFRYKFKKELAMPEWTEKELKDLAPAFADDIRSRQNFSDYLRKRLKNLQGLK